MKMSYDFRAPKSIGQLGLSPRLYDTHDKENNGRPLTPKKSMELGKDWVISGMSTSRSSTIKNNAYDNRFVYSQVCDRGQDYQTFPHRHEIERSSIIENYQPNNQLFSMKKQISSLKQLIHNPNGIHFSKLKEQIMQQVHYLIEQSKSQSAKSMKEALIKIDNNMKKECITQFSRQFLPLSYLDDSQKEFLELENKIKNIQQNIKENSFGVEWKQSIKPIEEELKKYSGETEQIRILIKQLQLNCRANQLQKDPSVRDERIYKKIEEIERVEIKLESQLKKIQQTLYSIKSEQQIVLSRLNLLQERVIKGVISYDSNEKLFEKNKIESKPLYEQVSNSNAMAYKSMSLTFSMESLGDILKPERTNTYFESVASIKDIKSSKYIIDNENNLLDENGNFILDEQGSQIRLTETQILMIRESNLIKYKEM